MSENELLYGLKRDEVIFHIKPSFGGVERQEMRYIARDDPEALLVYIHRFMKTTDDAKGKHCPLQVEKPADTHGAFSHP